MLSDEILYKTNNRYGALNKRFLSCLKENNFYLTFTLLVGCRIFPDALHAALPPKGAHLFGWCVGFLETRSLREAKNATLPVNGANV